VGLRVPLIYKNQAQFGLDIGTHTAKVVQLRKVGHTTVAQGFGYAYFPQDTIVEGIIVDPKELAAAIKPLLQKLSYGSLTSKRAIAGLPAAKLFTRTLQLPPMNAADLGQAVHYEVEQYVPVPITDLYIDYEIINHTTDKEAKIDVLMMAAPRAIVDSYIKLFDHLGLEIGAVESNMTAVVRSLLHSGDAGGSTMVMDIGSLSSDMTIYDKFTPLTGTVAIGGETYTNLLSDALGLQKDQANEIKIKFGIGPSGLHDKIYPVLEPQLTTVVKEVKKVVKYYQDRGGGKQKVQSMVISGGTAGLPGLREFYEQQIGLPLKVADPWRNIDIKKPPIDSQHEAPMYTTAIGLALRGLMT
jgi:type IV pilus assembly protein PilM